MNKNFMNMMANASDDSSDEERPQRQNKQRKLSKKEQRVETQNRREAYGTGNQKERPRKFDDRAPRRNFRGRGGRGRDRDRQSGTGRQAHGNPTKKGGHGRGNVGSVKGQMDELDKERQYQKRQGQEQNEENKPEPIVEEKIVNLDDYLKEKNVTLGLQKQDQVTELKDPKMFEDENTTAVEYKKKDARQQTKQVDTDSFQFGDTIIKSKPMRGGRRGKKKRAKKAKPLGEDDFPALS